LATQQGWDDEFGGKWQRGENSRTGRRRRYIRDAQDTGELVAGTKTWSALIKDWSND